MTVGTDLHLTAEYNNKNEPVSRDPMWKKSETSVEPVTNI